jgi:Spy/CpxP family protein refolding chaperone
MRGKALTLLLVFSLAFNIAFMGIWAHNAVGRAARRDPSARRPEGPEGRRRPGAPPWQQIGLRPEQVKQLEEEWRKLHPQIEALKAKGDQAREELLDLLAAPQPDREAIMAAQSRLEAAQQEVRVLVVEEMLQMRQVLDPQQRAEWLRMMRERGEQFGWGPRPPGAGGMGPGMRPKGPGGPQQPPRPPEGTPGPMEAP